MNWLAIFLTGILGGFINTLAGSGSVLILPLLIFTGLDPITANGTLRLGILMQSITAVSGFKKNKLFEWKEGLNIAVPALIGAITGSLVAVSLDKKVMNWIIVALLFLMVILLILKPTKWINAEGSEPKSYYIRFIVFLAVGFYGGFIQAGVGFFLIAALVFVAGMPLIKANAVKMLIVMIYTPIALSIFALHGNVDFYKGLVLSAGMMAGAFLGVKVALKKGSDIIRWFLILAIIISAGKIIWNFINV